MTGDLVFDLAISVAGIIVLVAVSWLLGGLRSAEATREKAAERLSFDEPDFAAGEWLIGADGKAAAAISADGREIALVFAVGDGLATRRFDRDKVVAEQKDSAVVFRPGEPSLSRLKLAAPDAATAEQWFLRLSPRRI